MTKEDAKKLEEVSKSLGGLGGSATLRLLLSQYYAQIKKAPSPVTK